MATVVEFNSGQNLTLSNSFDQVNQQLGTHSVRQFTLGDGTRVTAFAANIQYLQDVGEGSSSEPMVAAR